MMKKYDRIEQLLQAQLAVAQKQSGPDSPEAAAAQAALGKNLLLQKKHAEAADLLQRCLAIRERKQPAEWGTANARSLLGGALAGLRQPAAAEPLLTAGYRGLLERAAKLPVAAKRNLPEAARRLAEFHAAADPHRAAAWAVTAAYWEQKLMLPPATQLPAAGVKK